MTTDPSTPAGADQPGSAATIDPALLAIIVCPSCRSGLDVVAAELVCSGCGLAYPVRDDIPVLLVDEARKPA